MSILEDDFVKACDYVESHHSKLDEKSLLLLYGYFKQFKNGNCDQPKPWVFDLQGRAKWNAWNQLAGLTRSQAMQGYVDVLTKIMPNWRETSTDGGVLSNWISVSTMAKPEETLANGLLDWVKDGDFEKIKEVGIKDPKLKDEDGLSLLHWACDRGHLDMVKYLIEIGKIDVNGRDNENQTPLHYAVACGHVEICQILLNAGADLDAVDNDNSTPKDQADDPAIIKLLSNR